MAASLLEAEVKMTSTKPCLFGFINLILTAYFFNLKTVFILLLCVSVLRPHFDRYISVQSLFSSGKALAAFRALKDQGKRLLSVLIPLGDSAELCVIKH